jgi:hypothetical protein
MTDPESRQPPDQGKTSPSTPSGTRWWAEEPPPSASESEGSDPFGAFGHEEPLGPGFDADGRHCLELCPICRGAELLRAGGAPELRGQLDDFGREALLTLRALIDHYLERTEARERGARVEEIPID